MRWITLLLLGCLVAGWVACQWESTAPNAAAAPQWIRTVDGWERANEVLPGESLYVPPLHPLVIASGQLMLVFMAFLLFPPPEAARDATPFIERRRPNSDRRHGERRQVEPAAA